MVHAGAAAGVFDLKAMAMESFEGLLRAGATIIITYFCEQMLKEGWLDS